MRSSLLLLPLFCLSLSVPDASTPPGATPVADSDTPGVLAGCRSVSVLVERLNDDARSAGLDGADLQSDVEHALRSAGVPVLDVQGLNVKQAIAKSVRAKCTGVYVNVNVVRQGVRGPWAYNVVVDVDEIVRLMRPPHTVVLSAVTWSRGYTGVTFDNRTPTIRNQVDQFARELARDYVAGNRRK